MIMMTTMFKIQIEIFSPKPDPNKHLKIFKIYVQALTMP